MTANEITANLLIEIPKRWPNQVRVWRSNRVRAMVTGKNGKKRLIDAGVNGQADITGILMTRPGRGRRLEIEVKAGPDRLSRDQDNFRKMIESLGGIYVVARDVEETLDCIQSYFDFDRLGMLGSIHAALKGAL